MLAKVTEIIDPVYMVGGSVRDELLGLIPKDYDFATPLNPDEIEAAVRAAGRRPYLTGKRFGTVGFKLDGEFVEVTTFRTESYVKGSRKPQVEFVRDISADLSRRDFTINAIARRGARFIDPCQGQADISARVIRSVGSAKARFKEDPLRMLRAARFAAQLGFEVSDETANAIPRMAHKILSVSRERWGMEFDKLLMSNNPAAGLDLLGRTKLLNYMLPELSLQVGYDQNSSYHALELWEHTTKVVELVSADINLRWAALLHDIAKPFVRTNKADKSNYIKHDLLGYDLVIKTAAYLKWSKERTKTVSELVLNHMREDSPLREADSNAKAGRL